MNRRSYPSKPAPPGHGPEAVLGREQSQEPGKATEPEFGCGSASGPKRALAPVRDKVASLSFRKDTSKGTAASDNPKNPKKRKP